MNKFIKKIAAIGMASAMFVTATPTAFAASVGSVAGDFEAATDAIVGVDEAQDAMTEYNYSVTPDAEEKTDVYLTIDDGAILVTIPNKIVLSGTMNPDNKYEGYYKVKVDGDFSGDKVVNVVPDETVELSQKGWTKKYTATIAQDKTAFTALDVQDSTNTSDGVVSAQNLTAGSWHGTFNFNISAKDKLMNEVPEGYSLLYSYDVSATSADDVTALYCVPDENVVEAAENVSMFSTTPVTRSDTNIIENDGKYWQLSSDDTILIFGEGNMKDSVYAELSNKAALQAAVKEHFADKYPESIDGYKGVVGTYVWRFAGNKIDIHSLYLITSTTDASSTSIKMPAETLNEIQAYIDEVKSDYLITIPSNVVIEEGVTNVSIGAFSYCEELETVTIPNTVTKIATAAFQGCSSLKEITLPDSITQLDNCAFQYCTSLTNVTLPKNVSVYRSVFQNCTSLETLIIQEGIKCIDENALDGLTALKDIYLPVKLGSSVITGRSFGDDVLSGVTFHCPSSATYTLISEYYKNNSNVTVSLEVDKLEIELNADYRMDIRNMTEDELTTINENDCVIFIQEELMIGMIAGELNNGSYALIYINGSDQYFYLFENGTASDILGFEAYDSVESNGNIGINPDLYAGYWYKFVDHSDDDLGYIASIACETPAGGIIVPDDAVVICQSYVDDFKTAIA